MAELLVKLGNNAHPDPQIGERHAWKNGDVVVVKPDGHEWGSKERPPRFRIVRLPGVPVAAVADLVQPGRIDIFTPRPGMRQEVIDAIKLQNQIDENNLLPDGTQFVWSQPTLKRSIWNFSQGAQEFRNKNTDERRTIGQLVSQHATGNP